PRVQELTKIEERNGKKQDEVALLVWPRRHAPSRPVSPPVLGKPQLWKRSGSVRHLLSPRFPLDHSETARPTAAEWGGDESVETAQIAPPRCVDLEFQDAQQQRRLDWQSDEADFYWLMRRGPGQQPTSSGSGITVNQSQGFDTSAFSVRSASPAAAAVGAPQPSASESSPKPQRRRTSGDTAVGIDAGSSGSTDSNSLRRSLELDRQQQSSAFLPLPSMEDRRGKSSSGPINTQQQQQQQPQQQSQTPPPGVTSPVRRTRSLKENLMQRFNSSMVGGGAAVGIARVAGVTSVSPAPSEDSPKSFPPPLRGGSVVKVLPDKKLLDKASSSENLTNQNAAAADLNSLASLVQKKRDRSQESLEQAKTGGSGGISGSRKPPTPTPAVDSDDGSEVAAAKSKPPSGMARGANSRRLESPTSSGRGAAVVAAALLPAATDDSPAEANDTDRESPGEDQQSDGEVAAQAAGSHNHSSSLEFLMQDAQSRTAPQIRHPSARKIEYTSSAAAAAAAARREGSPALIEVHSAMVESMDKMVAKQRQFLSQVKEGSITVSEYREVMKSLLTMQTKTIHQILDAIQSNEKPS
uniref:FIP-RBD domain-containing protein n=1 Tax=Macrostomum lignano TaxID=282301 RepID=A0A1I8HLC1_9PLAT